MKPCRVFEPKSSIESTEDFTRELLLYKKRENVDLIIVEASMKPIVDIDGVRYHCELASPRLDQTENPFQRAFGMIGHDSRKAVVMQLVKDK